MVYGRVVKSVSALIRRFQWTVAMGCVGRSVNQSVHVVLLCVVSCVILVEESGIQSVSRHLVKSTIRLYG